MAQKRNGIHNLILSFITSESLVHITSYMKLEDTAAAPRSRSAPTLQGLCHIRCSRHPPLLELQSTWLHNIFTQALENPQK
ncbi:hypothetical protein HHK36_009494 [Tetracentron sinense]|uniref:Uncharacterized protein n=1 Tax=Tetracentron sinense TaxID=13715 RepID=A0A834ZCX6_TETSI|nr:hypothetical protein HHK36_009494 [Tetracentron sinense]